MRYHFQNIDRLKKAAKRIADRLGGDRPLSTVQNGLAVALGYRDWHEFDLAHASQPATPLDQNLPAELAHRRCADLVIALAATLGVTDGEAQYALIASRLTGDRISLDDQVGVRVACWMASGLWTPSGPAGRVVRHRLRAWGPRHLAMLTAGFTQSSDNPVSIITDNRCGICTRSDTSIPREPLPPFVPDRLRFAYGVWTEPDGAQVLFSRDYAPMWRLRDGRPPQMVSAADWIKHDREERFWDDVTAPWDSPRRIAQENSRLLSYGIDGLPSLVDILPSMVSTNGDAEMPRGHIERLRDRLGMTG